MEVQAASWHPLERGPTSASGDVGVTQPQDQPRHASLSLDQQAADILKLFGETDDCASTTDMEFDAFPFEDPVSAQFGAMDSDPSPSDPISSTSDGSTASSSSDSNMAQNTFCQWPMAPAPPTFGYEQTAHQPGLAWVPEARFDHALNFGFHGGDALGIHMPTSSPTQMGGIARFEVDYPPHQPPIVARDDYGRQHFAESWQSPQRSATMPHNSLRDDSDEQTAESADPCYAQLLYKCLVEAPDHTLSLRELYEWVAQHSQKARDPNNRGWQNSVRHNLSMNAAFQRVTDRPNSTKKGSLWRLTDEALRGGVISTTRYRKDPKRKPERRATPAPNRQASGAKGGQATRDASRLRQQQQRLHGMHGPPRHIRYGERRYHGHPPPGYSPYSVHSTPHSPQTMPHFLPHGHPISAPTSQPASPYFNVRPADADDLTPLGMHLQGYHQATPEDFRVVPKPLPVSGLEFLPIDMTQGGLFGDHDPELGTTHPDTPTPSLMTEASFMTDDHGMSRGNSREGTTFQ
ncbi:Fork-head transcriptional regulator 2 [Cercospora beticola]|uniref:Fork-head transcriptional regulator 2 n=1 Tax=Cercospora beticola TaxID=122368 RepID=A0A2G5IE46_CERBT|nr:Fork-head transcriptional regulator 2 [Cercospora beticola]PIB03126.1 Fork-head transcriptional regulator 2 [Cercospora beticola]WPB04415.1 hypothetical protein RHO25_009061 [Cercospora beticola]